MPGGEGCAVCSAALAGRQGLLRLEADALRVLHDFVGKTVAASGDTDAYFDRMTSNSCITVTAHDANMRGFDVFIPPDCSCARNITEHQQALTQLEAMAGAKL